MKKLFACIFALLLFVSFAAVFSIGFAFSLTAFLGSGSLALANEKEPSQPQNAQIVREIPDSAYVNDQTLKGAQIRFVKDLPLDEMPYVEHCQQTFVGRGYNLGQDEYVVSPEFYYQAGKPWDWQSDNAYSEDAESIRQGKIWGDTPESIEARLPACLIKGENNAMRDVKSFLFNIESGATYDVHDPFGGSLTIYVPVPHGIGTLPFIFKCKTDDGPLPTVKEFKEAFGNIFTLVKKGRFSQTGEGVSTADWECTIYCSVRPSFLGSEVFQFGVAAVYDLKELSAAGSTKEDAFNDAMDLCDDFCEEVKQEVNLSEVNCKAEVPKRGADGRLVEKTTGISQIWETRLDLSSTRPEKILSQPWGDIQMKNAKAKNSCQRLE